MIVSHHRLNLPPSLNWYVLVLFSCYLLLHGPQQHPRELWAGGEHRPPSPPPAAGTDLRDKQSAFCPFKELEGKVWNWDVRTREPVAPMSNTLVLPTWQLWVNHTLEMASAALAARYFDYTVVALKALMWSLLYSVVGSWAEGRRRWKEKLPSAPWQLYN